MIIVIEGPDGCGKSEVGRILAKRIGAKLIHFPDDEGVTGPMIRSYLRREWGVALTTQAERRLSAAEKRSAASGETSALALQALQVANRMERMAEINQCAGAATLHVVLVRYWQSGWVYGQLDGLSRDWLLNVHAGMAKADCNILLDVDAEVSMTRRALRDGDAEPERYEGKLDFTKRVVNLYRELWRDVSLRAPYLRPNSPYGGWPVIDASQSLVNVIEDAEALLTLGDRRD